MTDASQFEHLWQQYYPDLPPLAYVLRQQRPDVWWRFHSLPESKRYPDTPTERSLLLERHNAVATEVLGAAQRCWVVQALYTDEQFAPPEALEEFIDEEGVEWTPVLTEMLDHIDLTAVGVEPELSLSCMAFPTDWVAGKFDDLIYHAAIGHGHFLFMETNLGRVYAPYDGGADLLVESAQRRDEMKEVFEEWLSPLSSGL